MNGIQCVWAPGSEEVPAGGRIVLDAEESQHLLRARRVRVGAQVWAISGTGSARRCRLEATPEGRGDLLVEEVLPGWREPARRVTCCVGMVRGTRLEEVVRTGTALGVHRILLLAAERTERTPFRPQRWSRLAIEAAKQCGRGWIPAVEGPVRLEGLVEEPPQGPLLVLHPEGAVPLLGMAAAGGIPTEGPVTLVVGPEGDITPEERLALQGAGAVETSLGARRLRTEDAAVAALAILLAG